MLAAGTTAAVATSISGALATDASVASPVDPSVASPDGPSVAPVVAEPAPALVDPAAPPVASSTQLPVNLGAASPFAVLAKSGITDVYASSIKGNVGASPITGAAIGLECTEVTGTIYSVDAAGPLPCAVTDATGLTAAVGDEETAYTDAAGRTSPDFVDLGAGEIGGLTLTPGLYKWNTGLSISTDVTIAGSPTDVFIFQVAGTLTQASAKNVILSGGVQAKNIFWVSAGAVTIGTTAHFEGTILAQTMIAMNTGASINGSLLAQTAVTLQQNVVVLPDAPAVAPVDPPTVAPVDPPPVAPVDPPTVAPVDPPTVAPVDPPTVAPVDPPTATPAVQ